MGAQRTRQLLPPNVGTGGGGTQGARQVRNGALRVCSLPSSSLPTTSSSPSPLVIFLSSEIHMYSYSSASSSCVSPPCESCVPPSSLFHVVSRLPLASPSFKHACCSCDSSSSAPAQEKPVRRDNKLAANGRCLGKPQNMSGYKLGTFETKCLCCAELCRCLERPVNA